MPKVTIELDEEILEAARDYAERLGTTLDELIREALEQRVPLSKKAKLDRFFAAVDRARGHSKGWKWNREELYEERLRRATPGKSS